MLSGNRSRFRLMNALRNDDGGIRQARIAFIARDVPAMGYAIYHAAPGAAESCSAAPARSPDHA